MTINNDYFWSSISDKINLIPTELIYNTRIWYIHTIRSLENNSFSFIFFKIDTVASRL